MKFYYGSTLLYRITDDAITVEAYSAHSGNWSWVAILNVDDHRLRPPQSRRSQYLDIEALLERHSHDPVAISVIARILI